MASKHRCRGCHEYFPKDEFYCPAFHSEDCFRGYESAAARRRAKVLARRDQPKTKPSKRRSTFTPELKAEVRARDSHRCRWCGARGVALEVHHILYRSQGGPDEEWNLITLCDEHHRLAHSNKRRYQPVLQATLWLEYFFDVRWSVPAVDRWLGAQLELDAA